MEKMSQKLKILMTVMFLFTGLIVTGVFINVRGIGNLGANISEILKAGQNNTDAGENNSTENLTQSDIDKDGLFDEEEPAYRTDPLNPDTDGDGFLDGEEIASECSPIIPSPGDCGEIEKNESAGSLTEELADLITGGIIAGDLKPDNPDFIKSISDLGSRTLINNQALLIIDDSEISFNLTGDDSKKSRQEYINNLGKIFEEYITSASNQIKSGNYSNDVDLMNSYRENLLFLEEIEQKISKLNVPASWAEFHKKVLTFIKKSELFYQNITDYEKDPVKALLTLNSLTSLQGEYKNIIGEALNKIKEQGLTLESGTILYLLSNQE